MSEPTDAPAGGIPGPRTAHPHSHSHPHTLPLPPATVPAGPEDADMTDGLEEAYWSVHDGAAASASVPQVLARLPKITALIGRLAWQADRASTLTAVLCQLASAAMAALGLIASVGVLHHLFAQGPTPDRVRAAVPQLLLVAGFLATRALLEAGVATAQARVTPKIRTALESEFLRLTAHVRLEAVEDADWHDEVHRANDRGLFYARMIVGQVVALASAALRLIGTAGVLGILHPALLPLLLLSVVPVGVAAVHSARARFRSFKRWNALQRRIRVFSWLLLDVDAAAELRSDVAQGALLDEHRRLTTKIAEEDTRLGVNSALLNLAGRAVGGVGTGITYAALAAMLISGWLPLAAGAGAVLAIQVGQSSLTQLIEVAHLVYEHALWVDDLLAVQERSRRLLPRTSDVRAPERVKEITVRDVHFTYPGKDTPALNGVSFTLRAGETVAFVGLNGSGKSTCAKLLAGLYEAQRGSVRWDGVDVLEMDAQSVQRRVACVLQDPVRFPFSALSNITVGTGTLTEAEPRRAMAAARAAGADGVVEALPGQWKALLSKRFKGGQQLSGGQWAKIAVARGLYQDAVLLLLDEPTASMDPPSEHAVYEAVLRGRLRTDQITVLISHRLASVVDCDRILVFDGGRIVESGSHDELMAAGGDYAAMFTLQASGYRTGGHRSGSAAAGEAGP
ncbi:ABC transporter ATP-binding protein/permease (plasmid) [Streptomyces sp. NBC_01343]|uniref:ABC transporter ATP-binding protein n=1 Tax=Streptomyces sp. NBC_01343 TaxID=2903832 RepID=UPI002E161666|nr:ABC transporter ATP-binding protein/permease [Streptomyces sp. NBC_01343]